MSYQVIARKWRPQTFEELIGQEHISQTLINALRNKRLPHALLFTGPRGTGKTSSARILAKSLRCPNTRDFHPCGICTECQDIAAGRSLDVIEIDGASNNGVDAIRELRETVGYAPSSGTYKVYIIDEVHMLSISAFNALLKTLEEPPTHVVFILATTEVQKLPNTILSRCQRFDFRTIPTRQIVERLAHICTTDQIPFDRESLFLIARQSGGSMRDSQSLLDQVITYCGGELNQQRVIEVLGLSSRELLMQALESFCQQNHAQTLEVLLKLHDSGTDPKTFAQDLLEHIRHLLVAKVSGAKASQLIDASDAEISTLQKLSQSVSEEDLQLLFDITLKGLNDLMRSPDIKIALEMLLLRLTHAPRVVQLSALMKNGSITAPPPARTEVIATASSQPPVQRSTGISAPAAKEKSSPRPSPPVEVPAPPKTSGPLQSSTQEPQGHLSPTEPNPSSGNPLEPWPNFVEQVKRSNGFLGALLENTRLSEESASTLTLEVPERMKFLLDKLQDPDNIRRTETFLKTFWNKDLKVLVRLGHEHSTPQHTPKEAAQKAEQKKKDSELEIIENHPLVKSAKRIFKAEIVAIKENANETTQQ